MTADLGSVIADRDVVLCCGAGGVGKTTIAASIGVFAAAELDRRVMVLTIDPARRLAQALGVAEVGERPTQVDLGPNVSRGRLDALMLDPAHSWRRLITDLAPDRPTADALLSNRVYRAVTERFIQSHDYLAMAKLAALRASGDHDLIVVDTPPSRHAVDFLDAPVAMRDFFSSSLLKWMTSSSARNAAGLATQTFRRVAGRVLGQGFIDDIAEFFLLLNSLSEGFVAAADDVAALLVDALTGTVVVTTSDRQPAEEAVRFSAALTARDMTLDAVVVNRRPPASLDNQDVRDLATAWSLDDCGDDQTPQDRDSPDVASALQAAAVDEFTARTWSDPAGVEALRVLRRRTPAALHLEVREQTPPPIALAGLRAVATQLSQSAHS